MDVKRIFNRAIWVYILLAVFFRCSVDFSQAARERSHYLLGIFYNGSYKNYTDGIVYFDHLIRTQPSAVNFANLGTCYYQKGDFKKALYYYREALKRNPESVLLGQQVQSCVISSEAKQSLPAGRQVSTDRLLPRPAASAAKRRGGRRFAPRNDTNWSSDYVSHNQTRPRE